MPDQPDPKAVETPIPAAVAPNSETGDAPGGESPKSGEKLFSQAELDRLIDERLKRAKEKADADAKRAAEKATADALAEQGKYKELSEAQAKSLLDVTAERDALKAKADKYEATLNGLLEAHKAAVPEHVKPLLARLDPVEQLQWIADNGGKLGVTGVPATPKANGQGLSEEQKRAAQQQVARQYRSRF